MVETGGYGLDVLVNAAGILSSAPWRPSPASRPGRSALRGLRRRASPPLVAGCGEVGGVGFNAIDKLVPEQRRQQGYRALRERAEPDLRRRLTGRRGVDSYSSPVTGGGG